ncbi:MAG: tetratricopeptide repeat protein [Parvularculaceae bacterium]|nr:tetratricopeptide repeat protein [Parvularculaceae bacterium]
MDAEDASRSLSKANALLDAGNLDGAIDDIKAVLAAHPDHAYAQALLGACFLDKGFSKDALREAEAALGRNPNLMLAHRVAGLAHLNLKNFNDAEDAIRRSIELDPNDPESHRLLGVFFDSHAKLSEARDAFEEALRLGPEESSVLGSYADFLIDKGEIGEAEALLASAPDHTAGAESIVIARGKIALRRGRLDEAQELALWALQRDAQNANAINLLSQAKIKKNPVMAIWWSWAIFMQRFGGKTRIFIILGLWLAYNVASRTVLANAAPAIQTGAAVAWLSFCLLTWIGPAVLERMVAKELESVKIKPDF